MLRNAHSMVRLVADITQRHWSRVYLFATMVTLMVTWHRLSFRLLGMGCRGRNVQGKKLWLSKEEHLLADSLVNASAIDVSFATIGGLKDVKLALTEHVVWPLNHPELFRDDSSGEAASLVTGILLYGPPGTGKTMLARALAKELQCNFLNVDISTIFSRYVGDSEKMSTAVFTFARKAAPCVVFIDELDAFLSVRRSDDNPVFNHVKGLFLTGWDGLLSQASKAPVIVVGATNRRSAVDAAVNRRLPIQLEVPLPEHEDRKEIVEMLLTLSDRKLEASVQSLAKEVARLTPRFTGADLRELLKTARVIKAREMMQQQGKSNAASTSELSLSHVLAALQRFDSAKCNGC